MDLPPGYRWATAAEAENWRKHPEAIVVRRTVDSAGNPYTSDEADLAMPLEYPRTVMTVTIASYEDAGAQYTLVYPDGRKVLLGDAEDNYRVLADIIDDEYDKAESVTWPERVRSVLQDVDSALEDGSDPEAQKRRAVEALKRLEAVMKGGNLNEAEVEALRSRYKLVGSVFGLDPDVMDDMFERKFGAES
ncbi:MAG: hypothetical protein HOV97_05605 [Nonomuraea sp.]|nr:hypothetical protein [Nonomuraea sp.]